MSKHSYEYGYNGSIQYADYLELEDNMNFALEAYDSDGLCYYLVAYTRLGTTTTLEWGPLSLEDDIVPEESIIKYNKFDCDEKEIDNAITKFLSSKKRLTSHKKNPFDKSKRTKIVEVNVLEIEEALTHGINLFNFLKVELGFVNLELGD